MTKGGRGTATHRTRVGECEASVSSDLCFVDNQVNGRIFVAVVVVVVVVIVLVDQPCIHLSNQ